MKRSNRMRFKIIIYIAFLFLLGSLSSSVNAQSQVLTLKGYIIDLNYDMYFQPCSDSSVGMLESLNGGGFRIATDPHLGSMNLKELDIFRKSAQKIYCKFGTNYRDTTLYEDYIYYYYGAITIASFDRKNNRNEIPCHSKILVNEKEYSVGCFYTPNALRGFEIISKGQHTNMNTEEKEEK